MADNAQLIAQCEARAKEWLAPAFDEETRKEVQAMLDNPDKADLIDAFYRDLEFGTGGLRGIMGAGTNRMNKYIVGMATQGFANYINKAFPGKQTSVVVGHDCRNNGRMFAETVADIFSANGIKVYLFESLRPTPEISFAIRQLGCQAGVNVTASHNPREYNGYKAYWDDGAQVLFPHDKGIIDEVNKVKISDVKFEGNKDLIIPIGGEMDWDYIQAVKEAMVDAHARYRSCDHPDGPALMGLPEYPRGARADGHRRKLPDGGFSESRECRGHDAGYEARYKAECRPRDRFRS